MLSFSQGLQNIDLKSWYVTSSNQIYVVIDLSCQTKVGKGKASHYHWIKLFIKIMIHFKI